MGSKQRTARAAKRVKHRITGTAENPDQPFSKLHGKKCRVM
jgi:hypothetical protein